MDRRPGPTTIVLLIAAAVTLSVHPLVAQTVGQLQNEGIQALAENDYFGAIEAFGAALGLNSQDLRSTIGVAEAYYWLGEYDAAGLAAADALSLSRQNPEVLTLNGRISIGLGRLDDAAAFFQDALGIEPNNVEAEIGLAELAIAQGKNLDARYALERALRIRPDHSKALLSLVLVFEQLGEYQTAEDYLELALETHGGTPETHILAAEYALRRGNRDAAASHARTAQALDAENGPAAEIRAAVALLEGRFLEAITTAEEILRRNRSDAVIWFLRAQALLGIGRIDDAMDSFRAALRYEPDNEIVRLVAENVAIGEYPMDAPIRAELAAYESERAARLASGYLYSKALSGYQRALRLTPFDVATRLAYAELHRTLGHTATYLQELRVVQAGGEVGTDLDQRISVYENLLTESVASQWSLDQFTLPKTQIPIGLYLSAGAPPLSYPLSERSLLESIARNLRSLERLEIRDETSPMGFPDAFAMARSEDVAFFILIEMADTPRTFSLRATLHVARTGSSVATISASRTGPNRVSDAFDALTRRMRDLFPLQAQIVRRQGETVVIDAGARDGIEEGSEMIVLAPGAVLIDPGAMRYSYGDESILATLVVTRVDDLIAEASISVDALVDSVAVGDVAVVPDEEGSVPRDSAVLYPLLYDRVRALR